MRRNQDLIFIYYGLACVFLFSFWIERVKIKVEQNLRPEQVETINIMIVVGKLFYVVFGLSIIFGALYSISHFLLIKVIYLTTLSFGISLIAYFGYHVLIGYDTSSIRDIKLSRSNDRTKKLYLDFGVFIGSFKKACYGLMSKIL